MINKLMNFFLNHTLISLNTAPTPKNIFLVMTNNKYFDHQATHLLLKYYISKLGGMGVKVYADNADAVGGPKSGKTC